MSGYATNRLTVRDAFREIPTRDQLAAGDCTCRQDARNTMCPRHGRCNRIVNNGSGMKRSCELNLAHEGQCR